MKKYVKDMAIDELRRVWDHNEKLRREVWETALQYVDECNIGEYLYNLEYKTAEYDIGYCGAWMNIKHPGNFLAWAENCNNSYGIFWNIEKDDPGKVTKLCQLGAELAWKLDFYGLDDKNAARVEKRLYEICELFKKEFLQFCRSEYDWIDDNENLFDFWSDENQLYNYYDCFINTEDETPILRRITVTETVYI